NVCITHPPSQACSSTSLASVPSPPQKHRSPVKQLDISSLTLLNPKPNEKVHTPQVLSRPYIHTFSQHQAPATFPSATPSIQTPFMNEANFQMDSLLCSQPREKPSSISLVEMVKEQAPDLSVSGLPLQIASRSASEPRPFGEEHSSILFYDMMPEADGAASWTVSQSLLAPQIRGDDLAVGTTVTKMKSKSLKTGEFSGATLLDTMRSGIRQALI
ncbi:unnamed protein product, partial [Protopolystoma xenopodis]